MCISNVAAHQTGSRLVKIEDRRPANNLQSNVDALALAARDAPLVDASHDGVFDPSQEQVVHELHACTRKRDQRA